jgi:ABC-type multidrug transport system fused ATPase/permease subunit
MYLRDSLIKAMLGFGRPCEGDITVGGVELSKVSSRALRKNITVVPQDPTLFSGTAGEILSHF